ncbi:MAG: pentapeptide repeat-containing protein [Magnetococcales bacterium]|nr:pentapeptide repeat-containing protein [Magnetococcales bacterium]
MQTTDGPVGVALFRAAVGRDWVWAQIGDGVSGMDRRALDEALLKHNGWARGHTSGMRASFAHGDLRGLDLSWTDLRDADFTEANLTGANLSGADLSRATFAGAFLKNASLRCANLEGANFSNTDLQGTDLREAIIKDTDFWRANFRGCIISPEALHAAMQCSRG